MEIVWVFGGSAVTAVQIDFLDPALSNQPDVRERGVRVEIRPLTQGPMGSIYSSPSISLAPAVLRIDLLESSPFAADRMHLHPDMVDGEPGDRTFDSTMSTDPIGWLRSYLERQHDRVGSIDGEAIAKAADMIAAEAGRLLEKAREPWPDVTHDARGLATY